MKFFAKRPWRTSRARKDAFKTADRIERAIARLEATVPTVLPASARAGETLGARLEQLAKRLGDVGGRASGVYVTTRQPTHINQAGARMRSTSITDQ